MPIAVPGSKQLSQAPLIGRHDPNASLNVDIVLPLRNRAKLEKFLADVQNPASADYHRFLTSAQVAAAYGPSNASVAAVSDYLKVHGLTVTGVSRNRMAIHVTAESAAYERAFSVQLNNYSFDGRTVYGPAQAPRLPADIADRVSTILGLSNAVRMQPSKVIIGPIRPIDGGSPCPVVASYTPQQIASAYGWPNLSNTLNGNGVTIAIATADSANFSKSDARDFWSNHNLPSHMITVTSTPPPGSSVQATADGVDETDVDVEWAGAMAPGANIRIYDGNRSLLDFYHTYEKIVQDDQVQVVTTSWGAPESQYPPHSPTQAPPELSAFHALFSQAGSEGMTVVAAAGDSGSNPALNGGEEPDYPSSDPNVLAAGGTRLILNADGSRQSEVVWNGNSASHGGKTCYKGATGGAESRVFSEPSWQTGAGVPQNGSRNTTDLALDADWETGYDARLNGQFTQYVGGTSFIAPELAGLFADFISLSNGENLGNPDPAIYADAASHSATDFYDITSGNNGAFDAASGWDHPSGWGSMQNADAFLTHLDGGIALSAPTITGLEFTGCRYQSAQYLVTAQAGDVGSPQEWELQLQQTGGSWVTVSDGAGVNPSLSVGADMSWRLRLRGYSGAFWTPWTYRSFNSPPCSGGGGGAK